MRTLLVFIILIHAHAYAGECEKSKKVRAQFEEFVGKPYSAKENDQYKDLVTKKKNATLHVFNLDQVCQVTYTVDQKNIVKDINLSEGCCK